jgi:hypothetical protein
MYSYVIEFNLERRGEAAEEYLAEAARSWPKLWLDIPGVTGTLLLSGALALGGEFEYQWRVDIETLSTLARIDEAIAAGEGGWRRTRKDWFAARTVARAQVLGHVAGNEAYCQGQKGKDAAVHLVLQSPAGASERSASRLDAVTSASGVVSAQALRSVVGSAAAQEQTWLRLESLESLDSVDDAVRADLGGSGRLFGELREVDGSLFAGA